MCGVSYRTLFPTRINGLQLKGYYGRNVHAINGPRGVHMLRDGSNGLPVVRVLQNNVIWTAVFVKARIPSNFNCPTNAFYGFDAYFFWLFHCVSLQRSKLIHCVNVTSDLCV